jgi:hypothetical protein
MLADGRRVEVAGEIAEATGAIEIDAVGAAERELPRNVWHAKSVRIAHSHLTRQRITGDHPCSIIEAPPHTPA